MSLEHGELCVTMAGIIMMLELSAENLVWWMNVRSIRTINVAMCNK